MSYEEYDFFPCNSELHEDIYEAETQKGENIRCSEGATVWIWRNRVQGLQRNFERVSENISKGKKSICYL